MYFSRLSDLARTRSSSSKTCCSMVSLPWGKSPRSRQTSRSSGKTRNPCCGWDRGAGVCPARPAVHPAPGLPRAGDPLFHPADAISCPPTIRPRSLRVCNFDANLGAATGATISSLACLVHASCLDEASVLLAPPIDSPLSSRVSSPSRSVNRSSSRSSLALCLMADAAARLRDRADLSSWAAAAPVA